MRALGLRRRYDVTAHPTHDPPDDGLGILLGGFPRGTSGNHLPDCVSKGTVMKLSCGYPAAK